MLERPEDENRRPCMAPVSIQSGFPPDKRPTHTGNPVPVKVTAVCDDDDDIAVVALIQSGTWQQRSDIYPVCQRLA